MKRIKWLLVAAGTLAVAATLVASPASASAAPCGLSGKTVSGGPVPSYYKFTIRNCHPFTIRRRIVVARSPDSHCLRIRRKSQVRGNVNLIGFPIFSSVKGLRRCGSR